MKKGQIVKALSGFYYVKSEDRIYQARARGLFRKTSESPLVGDIVRFQIENETEGYITAIDERRNSMVRPPVANIDQVLLAMSLVSPDFNYYLLDRFIAYAEAQDMKPVVVITKTDLAGDEALMAEIREVYDMYPVFFTDNNKVDDEMLSIFKDKLSVLAGQSGVGKSTLINTILPGTALITDEISNKLNRGKHTTRHVELIEIAGGYIADTPGFSTIDFSMIDKYNLKSCFIDFDGPGEECKFRECLHINEPKCGVKLAVEEGRLAASRYESYKQIFEEIESRKERY
ncbi:ribosome small subunit-dependent GTPase A [Salinicoccus halitifaciens]|uniref:Small ribosomal subunit biogenesis GTPase RsgA n=1 Tax=Salinicoccus halitifaciens TaxID=1073415 RepID=A0ABV2E7C3_9STAP|nr:ribosome small subunit-dependent GTPase A [Salinicoccus halitifaciens]MCD2136617.1 ribosome small subunit-dependent GTPase A [Salinicoccus halitifaciens]